MPGVDVRVGDCADIEGRDLCVLDAFADHHPSVGMRGGFAEDVWTAFREAVREAHSGDGRIHMG